MIGQGKIPARLVLRLTKIKPVFWIILACLFALIPLFILARILATTGADTISNDYLRFTRLADQVLSPGYDWRGYFKDSFDNNVHSYAFLFLFRLALNELTHLSVMVEIYVGLALSLVKVLILYLLFTRFVRLRSILRLLLLPALSFLVFSLSQFSTYSFGETALQMGWTQVWILVGLWMLFLHGRHPLTPLGMLASGVLASYSGGSGVLAWPVFFLAILLTEPKNFKKYLAWILGFAIGLWPYFAYSTYTSVGGLQTLLPYLTPNRFLTGLGLPMANNINYAVPEHPEAIRSGLLGLGFLILTGILFIPFHSSERFKRAAPGLLLVFWGILSSLQITASRTFFAPWYTSSLILFWIGLLGLSVSLVSFGSVSPSDIFLSRYRSWIWRSAGLAGILLVSVLFVNYNHSYEDKSFYLTSRSPASAACLRAYQSAPTVCEGVVFQWGVGNPSYLPQMGTIVDKYNWSVLGPHQEWTLQGDYVLGRVNLPFMAGQPAAQWVQETQDQPAVWSDYHHLNLLLNPGSPILWQVDFPPNLKDAAFEMGFSPVDPALCAGASLSVSFEGADGTRLQVIHQKDLCGGPHTLTQDLLSFAGKSLVIRITNDSNPSGGQVVRLQYPHIELDRDLSAAPALFTPAQINPVNTDLSLAFSSSLGSAVHFLAPPATDWSTQDLTLNGSSGTFQKTGPDPALIFTPQPAVCLANWSAFYFRLALSDKFDKKMVHITFQYHAAQGAADSQVFDFPLLSGEDLHSYSLNLDLLNIPASACITGIKIQPNAVAAVGSDLWIQAIDFGILPRREAQ